MSNYYITMTLYRPVDLGAAYADNQRGRLSIDQLEALTKMLKSRFFVGIVMFLGDLLLLVLFGAVLFSGDWQKDFTAQMIFLVCAIFSLSGVLYGLSMWVSAKKASAELAVTQVIKVVGEATKYNYGVAVPVAGATHTMVLRHGYIKLNGIKYGVLNPPLYNEIVDAKKTDFYIVPIKSTGFAKGVVVNCSN